MGHTAIWIAKDNNLVVKHIKTAYVPGDREILVKVAYHAINPADIKHATILGINDCVAGYDFSGIVASAGSNSKFKKGDAVFGTTPSDSGEGRKPEWGTYQDWLICPDPMAMLVPANLPLPDASGLSIVTRVAADTIFNMFQFPLEFGDRKINKPFLIWGAGSVGYGCLQFAAAIGIHPIFITASPICHQELIKAGATECFDYQEPDVVQKIRKTMTTKYPNVKLMYGFDAVGSHGPPHTADLVEQCCEPGAKIFTATEHPRYGAPFATREYNWRISTPKGKIVAPLANAGFAAVVQKALEWAVKNYGTKYRIPPVRLVKGVKGTIKAANEVAWKGVLFQKVVVEHPFEG
ncbi:MAG: hypothetical protein M1834_002532 [Cirrosporium novae-zelandiae]|nr:MAG: hypothetical protein M1834_002532 [Cirrosporium novae-zelandiae]